MRRTVIFYTVTAGLSSEFAYAAAIIILGISDAFLIQYLR
jgi:hypothetical protein